MNCDIYGERTSRLKASLRQTVWDKAVSLKLRPLTALLLRHTKHVTGTFLQLQIFVNPRVRTSFLWFIISRSGVSTARQFCLRCSPWRHSQVSSRIGRWRCALPCCEAYWASCACYGLLDQVHKCLCGLTNNISKRRFVYCPQVIRPSGMKSKNDCTPANFSSRVVTILDTLCPVPWQHMYDTMNAIIIL